MGRDSDGSGNYHLAGMRDTPRIDEALATVPNYLYRGVLFTEVVARQLSRRDLVEHLKQLSAQLATSFDLIEPAGKDRLAKHQRGVPPKRSS